MYAARRECRAVSAVSAAAVANADAAWIDGYAR